MILSVLFLNWLTTAFLHFWISFCLNDFLFLKLIDCFFYLFVYLWFLFEIQTDGFSVTATKLESPEGDN